MEVQSLAIPAVKLVKPKRYGDDRGFFEETYNERRNAEAGLEVRFVQDNHSKSAMRGTLRGLHYQAPPFAQTKLVRVVEGRILDVAVDARKGSDTFGQHVTAELSAENGLQIFVPAGFLHGFITLEPNTQVTYKVDAYYSAEGDGSVRFDDPALGIDWGEYANDPILSDKDRNAPGWDEFDSPFIYGA